MRRLILLDEALDDLSEIVGFVAADTGSAALGLSFGELLLAKCSHLASLPGTLGVARRELRPDIRSFAVKGYVIFFRYVGDELEVVRVLEGHRDAGGQFQGDGNPAAPTGRRRDDP